MTKRFQLKKYLHALNEIEDILSAMKNLAFIEINKLNKYLKTQENVVKTIDEAGADFLSFNPVLPINKKIQPDIYIFIGSERGFCGDFNDALILEWQPALEKLILSHKKIVVIGNKLIEKFDDKLNKLSATTIFLDGPSVAEEIPNVILNLLLSLKSISPGTLEAQQTGNWQIIYNVLTNSQTHIQSLHLLQKIAERKEQQYSYKPILNFSREKFLFNYLEQYLFANLYYIFYQSLMAENDKRLQHINNAKSRLDKKRLQLSHRINFLRQEEITEEIENILLSIEPLLNKTQNQ